MLAIFNDTIFDNRTELEKQLDELIEKRRMKKAEKILDERIEILQKQPQRYKRVLAGLACGLMLKTNIALGADFSKIDNAGMAILTGMQRIGYWTCLIMAIVELIKAATSGSDKGEISRILVKYILIMMGLYGFQWLFDIIVQVFSA